MTSVLDTMFVLAEITIKTFKIHDAVSRSDFCGATMANTGGWYGLL